MNTHSQSFGASALALTSSSGLAVAGSEGIWILEPDGCTTQIAREYNGEALAINEAIVDPKGRLLVGSAFFDESQDYPLGKLYLLDIRGNISVLDEGFHLANGMGFSSNGQILYVTDSILRVIYSYDYDSATGSASRKRVLVKLADDEGLPDGMTVDAEDFIWSAQWFGGCVCRFDPEGRLERRVQIPAQQSSSITFGGPEYGDAFVTSASEWDALSLAPRGYTTAERHPGGELFHFRSDVQGKPEYVCAVRVASLHA